MPVINLDRHQPAFYYFPTNNNRTAWRPYGMPTILVVPHKRDVLEKTIFNSSVFNVRIYVEDVPSYAYVAGQDHIGLKFPDKELYGISLDSLILADKLIPIQELSYYRNGVLIDQTEAITGDMVEYTTASGIIDQIEYIQGADYYDLSDVLLDVELLPSNTYKIVYSANYYPRIVSKEGRDQFICIDINSDALTVNKSFFQHPGKVIDEFYRHTPSPYLTNASKSQDTTIALYRPFTDLIQDIMDEQDILERVNWVYDCPFETIPYLSALLGWDLPFFPRTLDNLRRAVLRRTTEFQQLKGSRRAIINLFRLFGYEILISNLWWSSDGTRLIRPDQSLPYSYQSQEIVTETVYQTDLMLADYKDESFEKLSIPLLYRPQLRVGIDDFSSVQDDGNVTIDSYAVVYGSPAYQQLLNIAAEINNDPSTAVTDHIIIDNEGFINQIDLHTKMEGLEFLGYSQLLIEGKFGLVSNAVVAGHLPPLNKPSVVLNRESNVIDLNLNFRYDTRDDVRIFTFATYGRVDFKIPDPLKYLQSNKFDIQVLTPDLREYADPTVLDFAIEFIYKLKAMHSILHVIRTRMEMTETYEVTDLSIGGDFDQRYDTDIGRLQVPPAIIPNIPATITECALLDAPHLGYKEADEILRLRKLQNLEEEYAAWKSLDGRSSTHSDNQRLFTFLPNGDVGQYNYLGQDRIVGTRVELRNTEYTPSPNTNQHTSTTLNNFTDNNTISNGLFYPTGKYVSGNLNASDYGPFAREYTQRRTSHIKLDGTTDYSYKGRVDDELLHQSLVSENEVVKRKSCAIGLGIGVYYAFPSLATIVDNGTMNPAKGSSTPKTRFSGGSKQDQIAHYKEGTQEGYLSQDYNAKRSNYYKSFLGDLYRSYGAPSGETIHYSNRIEEDSIDQTRQLALIRPSLEVEKCDLHLPGCRFPRLNALKDDYESVIYKARPWDDKYSTNCGPLGIGGNQGPSYLHFIMNTDSNGDEFLSYDDVQYSVDGNNLIPDIGSLGDHTLGTYSPFDVNEVIHKIYSNTSGGSPALQLEQLCDYDTNTVDGIILTNDPLFKSHSQSQDSNGQYSDYADGYPCVFGYLPYSGANLDRDGLYADVMAGLGLEINPSASMTQFLFTCGSGIRIESGLRLDCGCLIFGMEENPTTNLISNSICSSSIYLDQDGEYDWNSDHIRTYPKLSLYESAECEVLMLDGTVNSLLETV